MTPEQQRTIEALGAVTHVLDARKLEDGSVLIQVASSFGPAMRLQMGTTGGLRDLPSPAPESYPSNQPDPRGSLNI